MERSYKIEDVINSLDLVEVKKNLNENYGDAFKLELLEFPVPNDKTYSYVRYRLTNSDKTEEKSFGFVKSIDNKYRDEKNPEIKEDTINKLFTNQLFATITGPERVNSTT